jgi:hypothetical protein
MRKAIGVVFIIASVILLIKGHDIGISFASRVKQTFAGVPLEAAMKFYLAGAGIGLAGVILIFSKK